MRTERRRLGWRIWRALLLLLALADAGALTAKPSLAQTAPALSRTTVPAIGHQEALLSVSKFGRYAVTVSSAQGTALQLIDRSAGPGEMHGEPGKTDGRLDGFLDRGQHKVVTYAAAKGSGEAQLVPHTFTERNVPPPLLVELKPISATLGDFEQRSYWVEITAARQVIFEAAGRNLADLRLWSNGEWLVDAEPATEIVTPEPGHPLLVARLAARLDPGFYLLTAYGGSGQPWAQDSPDHPFHLRFGIPRLPQVGRSRHTISPFGIDRYLVPGAATYFRVELPEARPATLSVGWFSDAHPFEGPSNTARIEKSSLVPVAELEVERSFRESDKHVVTVAGAAGQPYVLQHFDAGESFYRSDRLGGRFWRLGDEGKYWVSTVHSGEPSDSIDATALIVRVPRRGTSDPRVQPFASQVVELSAGQSWARRCNLLEPLSVFIHVQSTGKYEILSRGTKAKFRFEPFLLYEPEHYEAPELRGPGSIWDLDAGYYILTAEPEKQGIVDIAVRSADQSSPDVFAHLIGKNRDAEARSTRAAAQFPEVVIDHDYEYTIYLNRQPEVKVGMVLRRLPVDLTEALPAIQRPGEKVSLPFKVDEPGTLRAEAEDGSLLPVSVDGGAAQTSQIVKQGQHRLEVRYSGDTQVHYNLVVEPLQMQASAPLPPLPDSSRAAPPKLRVLTEKVPLFFDLDRQADATFLIHADAPALYRVQSTGLLSTQGKLRTRTVTSFDHASANGVGHNFFIEQYLREGDYQVTVSTLGSSKGHLGLSLDRTPLTDGGNLTPGVAAHVTLPAGEAISYAFTIPEAGNYHLRSIGAATTFRGRLEDAEGWPIERPNSAANLTRHFEPGTYRFISLPEPVAGRRLTLLERIQEPPKLEGHGPHTLPLAQRLEHVWMEPADGGVREPDVWTFALPAPVNARIDLTDEMQGTLGLVNEDQSLTPVATLPPGRGWNGKLAAGQYHLEAVCARPDNRHAYGISVWPEQLIAGLDREVTAPLNVPVSVGRDSLVQLNSFGSADVRARLYDDRERLVAANDDGPDDWNFLIQGRLRAGLYRLQVDPVGIVPSAVTATCSVSMRSPQEVEHPAVGLPVKTDVALGTVVQLYPLSITENSEFLLVAARSSDGVGVALEASEQEGAGGWRTVGSSVGRLARVEVPLSRDQHQYRVRLWSADGRATSAHLNVVTAKSPAVKERDLAKGASLTPVAGTEPHIGILAVQLDRPGIFRLNSETALARACSAAGAPCEVVSNSLVTASGSVLWLAADLGSAKQTVSATRVALAPGADRSLQFDVAVDRPVVCDLAGPTPEPVLAMATSMSGQPGVRLAGRAEAASTSPGSQGMAVGLRSAVAVTLNAPQPLAVVWSASGSGEPVAVRLQQRGYPQPVRKSASWGSIDTALAGMTASAFDLPAGAKRLRVSVQRSTVVVLSDGDRITSVHWRGDEPFEEEIDSTADRLTLLHTREAEDPLHVELLPIDAAALARPLAVGAPYERAELRSGTLRLDVAAAEQDAEHPRTLHVRAAGADDTVAPVLITAAGRVTRGVDLPLEASGGTLLVPHGPGLVLAWIDRRGEEAQDLWGAAPLPQETKLGPPVVVTLSGAVQTLRFDPPEPLMLHVRTSTPVVTLLKHGDAPPEVEVHPTGTVLDAYLTAEPTQLGLRAISGGVLTGTVEVTTSPVVPIGEGLGPEVMLSAGATRLFSFTVKEEGPVGIGVRANPDVVECTLLDSSGKRLGGGVVQMPTLKPGTYLMALHAPPAAGPVRVRPALAGIELPSTGPPEEVVRGYMQLATAPQPTASPDGSEE